MSEHRADNPALDVLDRSTLGSGRTMRLTSLTPQESFKWLRKQLSDAGLTRHAVLTMIKSALPATILLAAFQSKGWSNHFNVLNYLVAIEGLLAFCILPRAKFLQTLFLNVLMVCLATAVNLLALWSAIQARKHTAKPGDGEYNSSQSAVCAIWFAAQIYLTNALRSSRPQFQFPCINYCIFAIISAVQAGPSFTTTPAMVGFLWLELQAFLTGFGVAAGVSLVIMPHSNRDIALASTKGHVESIKQVFEAYRYLVETQGTTEACAAMKSKLTALKAGHTKLGSDLEFAVRDFGFSHLSARDFMDCYHHLREIYVPLLSLTTVLDIDADAGRKGVCSCHTEDRKDVPEPYEMNPSRIVLVVNDSLDLVSRLITKSTNATERGDLEKDNSTIRNINSKIQQLAELVALIVDEPSQDDHAGERAMGDLCHCSLRHRQLKVQQHMLRHSLQAILSMIHFVKDRVESGAWSKRKLMLPSRKTLIDWTKAMFAKPGSAGSLSVGDISVDDVRYDALSTALFGRNPEHLPPASFVEHLGEYLRVIPRLLKSPHSFFGLRAMCASMSLAIISYLRSSHGFFVEQRCLWAVVMTAIALNNSTGQITHNFMLRIVASVAGTIGSYVVWYIVDGHTAGVIFFTFVYMAGSFYWCVVKPRYTLLAIVSAVTPIITVGYALNVDILPHEVLAATDTPKYPIYRVAPYRLLNVIAGLATAYFWSVFPFPVTEATVMREEIGACAYLLAKYNAIMSETILADTPGSVAQELQKARLAVFHQAQGHIAKLKVSSSFSSWQLSVGGKLPAQDYQEAIKLLDALLTNMATMSYAASRSASPRLRDLADPARRVTNRLCLIAATITSGNPLPPYMLLATVEKEGKDNIGSCRTAEAALVVAETAADRVHQCTLQLREVMRRLCGELDFSLAGLSTAAASEMNANIAGPISHS